MMLHLLKQKQQKSIFYSTKSNIKERPKLQESSLNCNTDLNL